MTRGGRGFHAQCSCYPHACPCGFYGDANARVPLHGAIIQRFTRKLSGPLLGRSDLHIAVPAVPCRELRERTGGTASYEVLRRVEEARGTQRQRGFEPAAEINGIPRPKE